MTEYDLALSKAVLRNALMQLQDDMPTDILEENRRLIQEALSKEEIQY